MIKKRGAEETGSGLILIVHLKQNNLFHLCKGHLSIYQYVYFVWNTADCSVDKKEKRKKNNWMVFMCIVPFYFK